MRRYIPPSRWQLWMARYCKAGEISLALGLTSPFLLAMPRDSEYFSYRKYDWFWRLSCTFYNFLKMPLLFNIVRIFLIFYWKCQNPLSKLFHNLKLLNDISLFIKIILHYFISQYIFFAQMYLNEKSYLLITKLWRLLDK